MGVKRTITGLFLITLFTVQRHFSLTLQHLVDGCELLKIEKNYLCADTVNYGIYNCLSLVRISQMLNKMPMAGFELGSFAVGMDCFLNCATAECVGTFGGPSLLTSGALKRQIK